MKPERNEEEEKKSKEEDNFGSSPAHQPAPSPGTKQKEGGCACLYLLTAATYHLSGHVSSYSGGRNVHPFLGLLDFPQRTFPCRRPPHLRPASRFAVSAHLEKHE